MSEGIHQPEMETRPAPAVEHPVAIDEIQILEEQTRPTAIRHIDLVTEQPGKDRVVAATHGGLARCARDNSANTPSY